MDRIQVADVLALLGWVTCSLSASSFFTISHGEIPTGHYKKPWAVGRSQHLRKEGKMSYRLDFLLVLLLCLGSTSKTSETPTFTSSLKVTPVTPQAALPGATSWAEGGTVSQVRKLLSLGELCSVPFLSLFGDLNTISWMTRPEHFQGFMTLSVRCRCLGNELKPGRSN